MQVSVGEDMKKKWEDAKDAQEKREVFIAACRKVLHDLDEVVNRDLRQQVERHGSLSLGGSFAEQVRSTVNLLKQRYAALQQKREVSPDQLEKVQTSLDHMERRLAVLETAIKDT